MLIDTDNDSYVMYSAWRMQAIYLNRTWDEIRSENFLPSEKFEKIARAGRFTFYANTDPNAHDTRCFCVIKWGDLYGSK